MLQHKHNKKGNKNTVYNRQMCGYRGNIGYSAFLQGQAIDLKILWCGYSEDTEVTHMLDINNNDLNIYYEDEININMESELQEIIHSEFQKLHIKELYENPIWTERAFWVAVIEVENQTKTELKSILKSTQEYLRIHKLPMPQLKPYWGLPQLSQRDMMKSIRDIIIKLSQDGLTAVSVAKRESFGIGISQDQFEASIAQMNRSGALMEPKPGLVKCI